MLQQVLQEVKSAQEPLNLNELARKLNIDPSALEGMIRFWVRKGRLKDDDVDTAASSSMCDDTGRCGHTCPGPTGCPFVMTMPRTYSLKLDDSD